MYNFKKSHTTVISVMVFILSIFVLTLPIIGQTADLQDAWQSNETTFANTSETNETFIETSPKKTQDKLEPVDQIMHEADLLARSSRPISSLSIDTNDELPEIEPDLEHDPQFNLLNSEEFTAAASEEPVIRDEIIQFEDVEYTLYISANKLNLRSGPTIFADVISQLGFGDKVVCTGESDEWMQVSCSDHTGYVSRNYTSREMVFREVNQTMYVSANTLNLRSEPGTDSEVLATLNKNYKLTRIGIGDGWSKIKTANGKTGYVATEHLTDKAPVINADPIPVKASTSVSESEIALFTKIVAMESSARYGYEGYLAVASVIMNRVDSKRYPNTITKVVSQPGQFSVYTSTRTPHYNDNVRKAVKDALEGKRNLPGYVLFFAMPYAYENNVNRGGVFAKLNVYKTEYGHVWCYYPADRK